MGVNKCQNAILGNFFPPSLPPSPPQPTVEQFISMNRDVDSGQDLPSEMLRVCVLVCRYACVCA